MAQVIIRQYSTDPLVHTVASNARRRPQIRDTLQDSGLWACDKAEQFRTLTEPGLSIWQPHEFSLHRRLALRRWYEEHCKIYTAQEGNDRRGGFAIVYGNLEQLHHVERGRGDWLVANAISLGAVTLNCLAVPHLLDLYHRNGFETIEVQDNTDDPNGLPVHYMEIK